jgi:hypothetical protein
LVRQRKTISVRDPTRPLAIRVYVGQKRVRVAATQRIPARVSVRLKRDQGFIRLDLPTDVVPLPPLVPSGRFVTRFGEWLGAAGAVVAWRQSAPTWRWGIVTVGHLFSEVPGESVTIQAQPHEGPRLPGQRLVTSARTDLLDASLIEVLPADLTLHGIAIPALSPTEMDYWVQNELAIRLRSAFLAQAPLFGQSWRPFAPVGFLTGDYFPTTHQLIPDLGNLIDVMLVETRTVVDPPAFARGTSGSAWTVEGRPAALQVGRDLATSMTGVGQFLDTQLAWLRQRLEQQKPENPIQSFRLVAIL